MPAPVPSSPTRRRRRRAARIALVVGALVAMLLVTVDAASYAATGSPMVLGRLNSAGAQTTLSSTGTGPALRLVTASTASSPFSTNATGRVANLNADKVDGYDATALVAAARSSVDATRLDGRTARQVADLAPTFRFTFARGSATQGPNPGASPGVLSGAGATAGTYAVVGTLTVPCVDGNTGGYLVDLDVVRGSTDVTALVSSLAVPAASCGTPVAISARAAMVPTARLLLSVLDVDAGDLVRAPLSFSLVGFPATSVL
jgi:hypothetical protein